jgi:hypothetical protein
MSQKLFHIFGRVIERKTKQGIAGLRIDAMDKDLIVKSPLGSATTDAQGAFAIDIDKSQIKALFGDRNIVLFFKVFRDATLIASTEDSALWDRNTPDQEVTIKLRLESPDSPIDPSKPIDPPTPATLFLVQGRVLRAKGGPVAGGTVQVFGVGLGADKLLGQAKTDASGHFEIQYDPAEFKTSPSATLAVRLLDDRGNTLASTPNFAVSAEESVSLTVSDEPERFSLRGKVTRDDHPIAGRNVQLFGTDPAHQRLLGEASTDAEGVYFILYDPAEFKVNLQDDRRLFARLIDNQLPVDSPLFRAQAEENVDFKLGGSQPTEFIVQGHVYLQNTNRTVAAPGRIVRAFNTVSTPATQLGSDVESDVNGFYTIAYTPPASTPAGPNAEVRVFDKKDDTLLASVAFSMQAAATVDPEVPTDAVSNGDQDSVNHEVWGKLHVEGATTVLRGYRVEGSDLDAISTPAPLGSDISNGQGIFTLFFSTPQPSAGGSSTITIRKIHLVISSPPPPDGSVSQVYETDGHFVPDTGQVLDVPVKIQPGPQPATHPLSSFSNIPASLLSFLSGKSIITLEDIRKTGGLSVISLPTNLSGDPLVTAAVKFLNSQADLGRISSNRTFNTKLINNGFNSVFDVSNAPRTKFVGVAQPDLGDFGSAQTHFVARAQESFLNSVATGIRADLSNGFAGDDFGLGGSVFPVVCGCEDCHAAVSPLAYLADLLKYCLGHIENTVLGTRQLISMSFLDNTFNQPFSSLPASCESVDAQLLQLRILIEVLNKHLGPNVDPQDMAAVERDYLEAAYIALLIKLGTSFDELRLAKAGSGKQRQALADRLGIDVGKLNELTLDLSPASSISGDMARIFGIVDQSRSLSVDTPPDLQIWRLDRLRATWLSEDRAGSGTGESSPIIDPDLLGFDEIIPPTSADGARALWQSRRQAVDDDLENIKQRREGVPDNQTALNQIALDTLSIPVDDRTGSQPKTLATLAADRQQGKRIDDDLAQLHLANDAFLFLLRVNDLISGGATPVESEWEAVYSILAQVKKRQRFAAWRVAETTNQISLSPDFFQPPAVDTTVFPSPRPVQLREWLATAEARRAWEDKLQARTDQRDTVIAGVQEAISATEEETLPALRDALIMIPGAADGFGLDARAKSLSAHLLIDTQQSGCRKTTRVAQAIETLQLLLSSLRAGLLEDTYPDLSLNADHFDEEWEWLGSYATWRAAVFVFIYPENVLMPSLKQRQTWGFRELVTGLRSNSRLTPDQACSLGRNYSDYFQDVCALTLEASCHARTRVRKGDCRSGSSTSDRRLFYVFARGGKTRTAYWSAVDPKDASGHAQTFWEPLPGLKNLVNIIGASVYEKAPDQRSIYLFAITQEKGKKKLGFIKYDLMNQVWSEEPEPLELPKEKDQEAADFTAVVKQSSDLFSPPHLAICLPSGALYERKMNADASDWVEGDWQLLVGKLVYSKFTKVCAMIEIDIDEFYLMVLDKTGRVRYRLIEPLDKRPNRHDDGRWVSLPAGRLKGAFRWPDTTDVFVYLGDEKATQYFALKRGDLATESINNVASLEGWLNAVPGVSLTQYVIKDNTPFNNMTLLSFLNLPAKNEFYVAQLLVYTRDLIENFANSGEGENWRLADAMGRQFISVPGAIAFSEVPLWEVLIAITLSRTLKVAKRGPKAAILPHAITGLERIAPDAGLATIFRAGIDNAFPNLWAYTLSTGQVGIYRTSFNRTGNALIENERARLAPSVTGPFEIAQRFSEDTLQERRYSLGAAFGDNLDDAQSNLDYLEEAYYFVPVQLALKLQSRGQYTAALDLFRSAYDYTKPEGERKIYPGLWLEESLDTTFRRAEEWLLDPLNPHAIAATRRNTYTRYTILSIIRCFLEFADAEFTRDTTESVARARALYMTALDLLDTPELKQSVGRCSDVIGSLDIQVTDAQRVSEWNRIKNALSGINDAKVLRDAVGRVRSLMTAGAPPLPQRLKDARDVVLNAMTPPTPVTLSAVVTSAPVTTAQINLRLMAQPNISSTADRIGRSAAQDFSAGVSLVTGKSIDELQTKPALPWLGQAILFPPAPGSPAASPTVPGNVFGAFFRSGSRPPNPAAPSFTQITSQFTLSVPFVALKNTIKAADIFIPGLSVSFCIPQNPMLSALRLRAELNLYKLRHCRNIAGIERELDPYAAPTDTASGLPTIGGGGQLVLPGLNTLPPTAYRYPTLIERAKQLVNLAQQIEASMLSALEKRDSEFYNLVKARQDVRLARAGVRLQDLRVREAEDGVKLAELQQARSQIQFDHYSSLIEEGVSGLGQSSIAFLWTAVGLQAASAALSIFSGIFEPDAKTVAAGLSSLAGAASTTASILSTWASYERRAQDWELQKSLAQQDIRIGAQQVNLADDHVRVAGQERVISQTQLDNSEVIADFLSTKFTNVELYDWMSDVLEGVYSFFLQQATSMAQVAAAQLAFERQETPPPFIQEDYWEAPTDTFGGNDGRAPDRRGLTGSARLLQDIFQLDQHAFETNQRKLQLTKSISLAQMSPAEFQQMRETGVMRFHTPMDMFDRDFPGHYLRLIRRVRTSVIALIPTVTGIRATLSTVGPSRVVIGGAVFQKVAVRRNPETVALSAPINATGLFELDQQPELLLPFEGTGVEASWEFSMPRASNRFDFSTIADVILTIEYTALNSFDYRQQVIQSLSPTVSADMPFSFRNQFADQWYDLNNPDQTNSPMVVSFSTTREDFPPNVEDLRIEQVLLAFVRKAGSSFEVPVSLLSFSETGGGAPVGGAANTLNGVISTRRVDGTAIRAGDAASWIPILRKTPFGEWELALPTDLGTKALFTNDEIEDILFVITYSGRTPGWPA